MWLHWHKSALSLSGKIDAIYCIYTCKLFRNFKASIINAVGVCVYAGGCFLTLLTPFHLLDLVHGALEDVALVRLDTETGNIPQVGWEQLSQLLYVAALQLPSPLFQTAGKGRKKQTNKKQLTLTAMSFKHLDEIEMLAMQAIFVFCSFYFLK